MNRMLRKICRYTSVVVLVSMLTSGLVFASHSVYRADTIGPEVLADSAAVLMVGGSDDTCYIAALALIALGTLGLLDSFQSFALIMAGMLMLSCLCSC